MLLSPSSMSERQAESLSKFVSDPILILEPYERQNRSSNSVGFRSSLDALLYFSYFEMYSERTVSARDDLNVV